MGDRDDHPGRGGRGGGGRGGHEGGRGGHQGGDGSHRQELREDLTDVHHARDAVRDADTPEEKRKAQQKLEEAQKELKQDWGPGMPKGAGQAHHGGGGRDDDDHPGRGGRDDDHHGRGGHGGGRGGHEGGRGGHGGRRDDD